MFNIFSPYGKVTHYEIPDLKGLFLKPASDTATDGWTAFKDENGELQLPGNPGGGEPYRFIGSSSGEPRTIHSPGDFFYGEIDWAGKLKDQTKPAKGKARLSYHGPNTRYFGSVAFKYGASPDNHNIYMEGKCVAVAPYPVLGAALRVVVEELTPEEVAAGETPAETLKLIAICLDGVTENVYVRTIGGYNSGVTRKNYTDEFRIAQMKPYHPEDNPTGWELIGTFVLDHGDQFSGATLEAPRVPWFFNASATEAVSVRECEVDIEIEGIATTQMSYNKFLVSVSANLKQAVHSDEGNTPGFQVHIDTLTTNRPDWVNETNWPQRTSERLIHKWKVVSIEQNMTMKGQVIVAADYKDDELVELKYVTDHRRSHLAFYYYGIDDFSEFQAANKLTLCNLGDVYGDWVYYEDNIPDAFSIEEPFGITSAPTKRDDRGYLLFPSGRKHWVSRHLTGSKTEFDTGTKSDEDIWLFFFFSLSAFIHHADLRQEHMLFFEEEQVYSGYNELDTNIYFSELYDTGSGTDYVTAVEIKAPATTTAGQFIMWPLYPGVWLEGGGAGEPGIYVRGFKYEKDYVVADGLWFMEYLNNLDLWGRNIPNPAEYHTYSVDLKLDSNMFSAFECLQSSAKTDRELGAAVNDSGTRAVSMKYIDGEGRVKYFNYASGGLNMSAQTHAEGDNQRFYPIGVS